MKKTMLLTSTFWYEIVYSTGERLIFQFLDTTQDGRARCRLCNGIETFDVFNRTYKEIIEYDENTSCGQKEPAYKRGYPTVLTIPLQVK